MPVHLSDATRLMVEGMVDHTSGIAHRALRMLLNERTADAAFRLLPGPLGALEPVFRNTVSPTIVHGGNKHNVVPAEIKLTLDGRMVPAISPEQMAEELRRIVGADVTIDYTIDGPSNPVPPDLGLFSQLADVVTRRDLDGVPVPFLMPAATDGRWFAELGIQPYGFTPLLLPDGFAFQELAHAADERIPVAAVASGAEMVFDLLNEYPGL